ncbi:hypothetical protein VP01_3401g3 [Puccinia sorghi]|uniref:Integrase catalytic domain-containing protein n=1 Tax=Puccinia sorghi TaxID=27349 RepID=A0A0L6UYH6_9BASI|nr:hypothetical protein VP01_3401g3 [Puccinia sorghi]
MSKITKKPFKLTSQKVKKPWERIPLDLIGPIKPQSFGQHKYILSVMDNATGYLAGFPLVHKSNITNVLIRLLENENKRIGTRLFQFLEQKHIKQLISKPYHPKQNGRGRGKIGQLWNPCKQHSNPQISRKTYGIMKGEELSPWEAMQGYKLPDNYLKPLGNSVVFLCNLQKKGEKFSEKGSKGRLIRYNPAFRSYKIISSDGSVPKRGTIKLHGLRLGIKRGTTQAIWNLTLKLIKATRRMKLRLKSQKTRIQHLNQYSCQSLELSEIGAMRCEEDVKWLEAIEKEIDSIESHKVWHNHWEKPENPLNTTWTFKIKDNCHNDPLKNLNILQFDVQGAFLHAPLDEEAPRNWYHTLTAWFEEQGFSESNFDPCLYRCNDNNSMIFFHMDNLIQVGPGNNPNRILGIKYERTEDTILLSNPTHINHGLEELSLLDARPVSIPLTPNKQLKEADDEEFEAFKQLNINYRSAVGLLNYISMHTRPNISFSVSSLACFSTKPGIQHWHKLKKVWLYLKHTKDLKLTLKIRNPDKLLEIYSDSTWADDPKTRTSQSGYLCYLYGSLISWNSFRQRNITYSSNEAEHNPLVDSFHEGTWLKSLLSDI